MDEFQKEYENNLALKQQQQQQQQSSDSNITNANITNKRTSKVKLELKKTQNTNLVQSNDIKNLDEITEVNDINEEPTRDQDSM
jgi:myosin heavy subunit